MGRLTTAINFTTSLAIARANEIEHQVTKYKIVRNFQLINYPDSTT